MPDGHEAREQATVETCVNPSCPAEFPQIASRPAARTPALRVAAAEDEGSARLDPRPLPLINASGEMRILADLEAQAIRFAFLYYQGHMSAISRRLSIGSGNSLQKIEITWPRR